MKHNDTSFALVLLKRADFSKQYVKCLVKFLPRPSIIHISDGTCFEFFLKLSHFGIILII